MFEKSVSLLMAKNITLEKGLTLDEIVLIEKIYGIVFPKSLRDFLMTVLPVSKGFYNWRNHTSENIEYIKFMIDEPIKCINNRPEDIYWCEEWGEEPIDMNCFATEVKNRLKNAPKLVPIYAHRYMPVISSENPPVISIHGADIIYMGENLVEYFNIEFGDRRQDTIKSIIPIPFWTDIM